MLSIPLLESEVLLINLGTYPTTLRGYIEQYVGHRLLDGSTPAVQLLSKETSKLSSIYVKLLVTG